MSLIINESTSAVQIDSSRLQNGEFTTVYVSTTTIPGQLVTVYDTTGYLSSPQTILLSTVNGTSFSDGSHSTLLTQSFSYVTLASQNTNTWAIVNESKFPNPISTSFYKGVDARTFSISTLINTQEISSLTVTARAFETQTMYGQNQLINNLYINTLSSFISSSLTDSRFTVNGSAHIYGSTVTTGATAFRDSISTLGDMFVGRTISSKNGTISVNGDLTTIGSIRGQRGNGMSVGYLSTFSTASFNGSATIASNVITQTLRANRITSPNTMGESMNVMSSIVFSPTQSIRNTLDDLSFISLPVTIPSSVSSVFVTAAESTTTSNISFQNFIPSPSLAYITLGSTNITNTNGSLIISSIAANTFSTNHIETLSLTDYGLLTANTITMNDTGPGAPFSIAYDGGNLSISNYWMISSVNAGGKFNAPSSIISTNIFVGTNINSANLITVHEELDQFFTRDVTILTSGVFTGVTDASLKNVFINNVGGNILGGEAEVDGTVFCSSMKVDTIISPEIRFNNSNTFNLPVAYISSLNSDHIRTSSLTVSKIYTGSPELYSTVNSSTPWIAISTFQMNSPPFNTTSGLGTYFDQVSFTGTKTQTAYYSLFDPTTQTKIHLSSPYVDTVGSVTGNLISQPTSDSAQNIYYGMKTLDGWKIQKMSPNGQATTVAGKYRYFYGDGGFPLNAAFGPRLSVSITSPGSLLITDISNVRIRYVTTDPIVTTIAGTGASGYTGDGALAFNATFSNPTTTTTDGLGRIFITDTGNQVIRMIDNSTITTYGGNGSTGNTGDDGVATAATLNSPFGLSYTTDNTIVFSDLSNSAIRQITPFGVIERIAGIYQSGFGGDDGPANSSILSYPRGLAVDSANNIYFCDTGNARIRRIDGITRVVTTIAGNGTHGFGGDGGPAINANLSSPTGVALDPAGNVYITDTNNQCIRFVNNVSQTITTVAGRPGIAGYGGDYSFANFATLNYPSHIAYDPSSQYYYFADDKNARIRYVNTNTNIIFSAAGNGSPLTGGDGGPATNAVFGSIGSVVADSNDNLFLTDQLGHSIRRIDAVTSTITTVTGTSVGGYNGDGVATATLLSSPQTLVINSNILYFTDTQNQRLRYTDLLSNRTSTLAGTGNAGYNGDGVSSILADLNYPGALARSSDGSLYIGDSSNYRVRRVDTSSIITTYAGNGFYGAPVSNNPLSITLLGGINALTTSTNEVFMADSTTSAVWYLNGTQNVIQSMSAVSTPAYLGDGAPLSNAYFNQPTGLSSDSSGNFIISDTGNMRIRKTYTFGNPLNPMYVNMKFNYTNYFTSTGSAYITLNGNLLSTFNAESQQNMSYSLTNANILDYPLQRKNPVYGNYTPFIEITQLSTLSYSKIHGNLWAESIPDQSLLQNLVDSNNGIMMNSGRLIFPYQNNGITIQNQFNDASLRSVNYTGNLVSASDPALKESIQRADLDTCYSNLSSISLRRYNYCEPYVSTFQVKDRRRTGFLTNEISPLFPKSVTQTHLGYSWASSIHTLDTSQIEYTHFGVTQCLINEISTLEMKVAHADSILRGLVAQRKNLL